MVDSASRLMMEAIQLSYDILSPRAKRYIYLLHTLEPEPLPVEDIRESCARSLGASNCRGLLQTLRSMVDMGLVEEAGQGYRLSQYGQGLADALRNVEDEVRRFIENALQGRLGKVDLYAHVMTPIASTLGIAEVTVDEDYIYALALHTYLSTLTATTLSIVARENPDARELVRELERELGGET